MAEVRGAVGVTEIKLATGGRLVSRPDKPAALVPLLTPVSVSCPLSGWQNARSRSGEAEPFTAIRCAPRRMNLENSLSVY